MMHLVQLIMNVQGIMKKEFWLIFTQRPKMIFNVSNDGGDIDDCNDDECDDAYWLWRLHDKVKQFHLLEWSTYRSYLCIFIW